MIPDDKEDGYIYSIFWAPSESETNVLRYRNIHLQEPLQKPYQIQLMELRAKTIRCKIQLGYRLQENKEKELDEALNKEGLTFIIISESNINQSDINKTSKDVALFADPGIQRCKRVGITAILTRKTVQTKQLESMSGKKCLMWGQS